MSNGANNSYTQDIAQNGLEAIQRRRDAQRMGRTMQREALQAFLAGDPYAGKAGSNSQAFQMYAQQYRPQSYPVSFGRGDGKYNGWDTQGLMTTELKGRAEMLREQDKARAQALNDLIDQQLSQLQDTYTKNRVDLSHTLPNDQPIPGYVGRAAMDAGGGKVDYTDQATFDKNQAYNKAMDEWLSKASAPLLDAGDFAYDMQNTPMRDYAMKAGADLGIDPALVAGWYPESSQIGDYTQQRDLESIDMTGMPYSEYQQAMNQLDSQQQQQQQDMSDEAVQQASDEIWQSYGIDGKQLASAAQMTLPQLVATLNSDNFMTLASQADTAISGGGLDQNTLDEILNAANGDPATARALKAIYQPYVSKG